MNSPSENYWPGMRHQLQLERRFSDAIQIQLRILDNASQSGSVRDVANAWNMLSHCYQLDGQLTEAANAARNALAIYAQDPQPRCETLATYEMKLAFILASQGYFKDAVHFGQVAIEHFSAFHNPPDDFLASMAHHVARMRQQASIASA